MKNRKRTCSAALGALLLVAGTTACTSPSPDDVARDQLQAEKRNQGETLEKRNLEEKRKREEDPNAIGYVYKYTAIGEFIGYWITKGKISSNSSQRTPEQDIHWTCKTSHGCQPVVVDGMLDDGSFGDGDPGVFFFLADGTKVVLGDDMFIHTDRPITLLKPIPLFGGSTQ